MFNKQLFGLEKNGDFKTWIISVTNPAIDTGHVGIGISHGKLDGTLIHKTEIVKEGKQGRSVYEQAVFQAEARIKKQKDKAYRETKEELTDLPLLAMLAADYNKVGHRIKFPCYTSVKYDGVRCLASKHAGVVYLRSRTGQDFDVPSLSAALNEVMYDGEVLDGEIYKHGVELQDILSAVKRSDEKCESQIQRTKKAHAKACTAAGLQQNPQGHEAECEQAYLDAVRIKELRAKLEFHIFDIPMDGDFEIRLAAMREHEETRRTHPQVKYCVYNYCEDDNVLKSLHHKVAVDQGYEGVMIRNLNGVYESGKRSGDLQKYKEFMDEEFLILNVVSDKQGDGIFVLDNENGYTFNCVMGNLEERRFYFENKDEFIGKWLTVKFQTRYKDTLLPQFPVGIQVREGYKVGSEFKPSV